ncbi:MAG: valine--tRNA ligase [Bdellovibrionales bacterium RIFOXYC1_FULL_54_43]|nr:MAG: valine--tRNA ligase [Bdellovibrionales bacterium RIFOXYC1_FULL_54_43]OFZ84995.1 MAG: valine--tRNA ligase [Bdellovibrionales bacterium RIFOXYD1_FULL_55_31]
MQHPQGPIRPTPHPLAKSYEPATFETALYEYWNNHQCFAASDENEPRQQAFSMVIPPPNVTGALHMGHALTNTIQDILVRWRRMKGENTLWLPGTDHAGIATQAQVEKAIAKEGKGGRPLTRHDMGRDAFIARTWKWKEEHGSQITNQLKRLGSSLDWKRERFTMDEGLSKAVREVFVRLYEEGLIYRGERIINWCPRCQTALSDLEVIPTDRKGFFWHLIYKIVDDSGKPVKNPDGSDAQLVIATTRPETLLGDTAVAVHPDDERYRHLHGKKAVLPLLGRLIPIVLDSYVDREFGSGALKVTPAHDFNDYEIAKRHNLPQGLPMISVMGKDGRITPAGGPYGGLKFAEARERVLQDLREAGLLVKVEDHLHKVGLCQRCENVAEPIISKQWFVKIAPLAKPAIEAVEQGKIVFSPKSWEKTYFEWMYNIRDWCISRQLWWGHQIPAWYCGRCQEITVSREAPTQCKHCTAPGSELRQDEDVLDTWFSSALWPFSTLGWPESTKAIRTFYPTSILETGFDIIFFWVARMIMMGLHFMNDVPFRKVYLHAMVRDEKGEKMSKSKGNVIDPLVIIEKHGADPLRFTLAAMAGQGRDIKLSVDRVEGYRAFCNKLWNATKFFHLQLEAAKGAGEDIEEPAGGVEGWLRHHRNELIASNRWILSRLQTLIEKVEQGLEKFELNESAQALYEFTWHEFCDWYIEFSKLPLKEGGQVRVQTLYTLQSVLEALLKLMHPFMPFVTEELWGSLPWTRPATTPARRRNQEPELFTIMLQPFPRPEPIMKDAESERTIEALKTIIEAIRNFRGENNISPKTAFTVIYNPSIAAADVFMRMYAHDIKALARISDLQRGEQGSTKSKAEAVIPLTNPPVELRIGLDGLVNVQEETKRLEKELEKVNSDLAHVQRKLAQETFVAKAPPELVASERRKEQEYKTKLLELERALKRISEIPGQAPRA